MGGHLLGLSLENGNWEVPPEDEGSRSTFGGIRTGRVGSIGDSICAIRHNLHSAYTKRISTMSLGLRYFVDHW